jgi:hypothetical protein
VIAARNKPLAECVSRVIRAGAQVNSPVSMRPSAAQACQLQHDATMSGEGHWLDTSARAHGFR